MRLPKLPKLARSAGTRARIGGVLVFGRVDRCNIIEEAVAGRAGEVVVRNTGGGAAVDIGLNAVFAKDMSALSKC
jgi:hypothetical protein